MRMYRIAVPCLIALCFVVSSSTPVVTQSQQGLPARVSELEAQIVTLQQQLAALPPPGLRWVGSVRDRVVFFWENGINPGTGAPEAAPSVPLAPITEQKTFAFETGSTLVKGGTIGSLLQIDVYMRQRYFYRNAGQNSFTATTNPFVQIESPVFDELTDATGMPLNGVLRFAVFENGLHLAASKSLATGENGHDSRGNFGRALITAGGLDRAFGAGTGSRFFANDFTVRMFVENTVRGVGHFVAGTFTQLYGQ